MGVGKTTVGSALAERLELEFIDSDVTIEARHGRTGAAIAAEDGIEALHRIELEVLLDLISDESPRVVAAAASVIDQREARRALANLFTIWLHAPREVVSMRARLAGHRRDVPDHEADRLLSKRTRWYRSVSERDFDTAVTEVEEIVDAILAQNSA